MRCVSTDVNPKAVELAIANRDALHMDEETVAFRLGDLVSPVRPDEAGAFDVLVSNPPYIPRKVMEVLPLEVTDYEPHLALEGGEDAAQNIFRRFGCRGAPGCCDPEACLHASCTRSRFRMRRLSAPRQGSRTFGLSRTLRVVPVSSWRRLERLND